jgi:selenide, water dikinase
LSNLPNQKFSRDVLVGYETSDDAGVFSLSNKLALVQTIDFFTPIVDEPEIYGRIAAVNSLNDIYAMGGTPLSALSIVCYPQGGDWNVLGEIMLGGQKALNEENVVVLGGHSVDDKEIKFGYALTGTVDPKRVTRNCDAREGDVLILTKAIGTGVISTAVKYEKANETSRKAALDVMTTSARNASISMQKLGVNGCTDITGFGLVGHAYEMAKASKVTINLKSDKIPLLPDVLELIEKGMLTRGDKNNRDYVGETVNFNRRITGEMQSAMFDPQTAGGLLISLEEEKAEQLLKDIEGAVIIGTVESYKNFLINVD